ncbi:MAG: cysteine--tRNA ligase [Gemmatimonadetes bacterium]|nr:cysteine--tRNA ligase [Gemmatimonadota bacterium]
MGLRFLNTLRRELETFEPLSPGKATIYGCGPTVYGHAHIGNFRTFLFYDLVHRYLAWKGLRVRFVMNLTDVDDKTIKAAKAAGLTLSEYTRPYAESVIAESDILGIRRLERYPRATMYISEMLWLVGRLLERGLAYRTEDGSVFYDISAFPEYGKLSGTDLEAGRQGERVVDDDYGKDDVRDFALWKGVKPGDDEVGAAWDTPWGKGRPGWHLECSAMALSELGQTLDLHLGGEDLIFPHHEDEIAQSEGATGLPFARFWLHVKHLRVEGKKMSKSAGNFITVRQLLEEGVSPAAIRHQLISAQYRNDLNFTREGLEGSSKAVGRLLDFEERLAGHPVRPDAASTSLPALSDEAVASFTRSMDDDLNVSGGLAALFVFLNRTNTLLDATPALAESERNRALAVLASLDEVLGLLEVGHRARNVDGALEEWIEERIQARTRARSEQDWAAADAIRQELAGRGIVLEDGSAGTRWKVSPHNG